MPRSYAPQFRLGEQLNYCRAVADEYEDHAIDVAGQDELLAAIDSFRPGGDVLELACGCGIWTERLLQCATTVTAIDGAPEMLARARTR
ncbi:MAG: class I SAM-dependent methyltransferase, partial [Actinomycetota bacterium]|nr:class I SAM-dependent methyltransferase [Actinomycetota bacterium]